MPRQTPGIRAVSRDSAYTSVHPERIRRTQTYGGGLASVQRRAPGAASTSRVSTGGTDTGSAARTPDRQALAGSHAPVRRRHEPSPQPNRARGEVRPVTGNALASVAASLSVSLKS